MIVTCSNCSKRYLVDPRALGTPGRRVRCASCRHTWFQPAPEETQPPIELPPLPETPPVVRMTDPARRVQLPVVSGGSGQASWLRRAIMAIVALLVIAGLIVGRGRVMSAIPATARFYSMVGLGPVVPGAGLELRQVTPSRSVENGVPTLTIDGQVANVSSAPRAVPKLRIALRDANDRELQSWTVSVTDQPLAPGASAPFHASLQRPPDGATGVIVSFAPGGG
ncbi:MAG TPA: DUF3426 domain-containing protein [Stellaceae bacterium]|nr:DUF3426 domain-containing protein [Stellaceae bacterium]